MRVLVLLVLALLAGVIAPVRAAVAPAVRGGRSDSGALPDGFTDTVALSGLDFPTAFDIAGDGRIVVAEKRGVVKAFDGVGDTTPAVVADLRTQVHDYWDRGLTDVALHPDFPADPRLYVLYTHNAPIGGSAPVWTDPATGADDCPTPPGPLLDGCVASGRLSVLRLPAGGGPATEQVLIEDWCQQYPAHSVAGLGFGPDGALYASGGDGAGFTFVDFGSVGDHPNPCGDPPDPAGTWLFPPDSQGGALRSQDVGLPGDPVGLNGTLIRVDPDTGEGLGDNPLANSPDRNARRIVAYGFRNPFRFDVRPGTEEVWLADVGYDEHEELDRVLDATDATADNFGWPCYEGPARQPGYEAAGLDACRALYGAEPASTVPPWFTYAHGAEVTPDEPCEAGTSSITGVAFYPGGPFPDRFDGALFFADYARSCLWVAPAAGGTPDPEAITLFSADTDWPVDLAVGPDGALYYLEAWNGQLRRIAYDGGAPATCPDGELRAEYRPSPTAPAPTAVRCEALPLAHDWGAGAPLDGVPADGFAVRWTGSVDLAGGATTFAVTADDDVHLRVDGASLVQAVGPAPVRTRRATRDLAPGRHTVELTYRDRSGGARVALDWTDDNAAPVPVIDAPVDGTRWAVGDRLAFSGRATDPEDGVLPATALTWALELAHCPQACHAHPLLTRTGVASGTITAPDHEHPSHLLLRLTATDRHGRRATTTRRLDPRTVDVAVSSRPPGLSVAVGGTVATTPFTTRVIAGSTVWASLPSPQQRGGRTYAAAGWVDAAGATRLLNPREDTRLDAVFRENRSAPDTGAPAPPPRPRQPAPGPGDTTPRPERPRRPVPAGR